MDNISLIQETIQIIIKGSYRKDKHKITFSFSKTEQQQAIVFLPNQVDDMRKNPKCEKIIKLGSRCNFNVVNRDSFSVVTDKLTQDFYTKVRKDPVPFLVLNFANSLSPGGGVYIGANAQEEDLCRKSTLLSSLESRPASSFYSYHKAQNSFLASDSMILSPNVEIFRDENNELLDKPIKVAVLTYAAPNLYNGMHGITNEQLRDLLYNRIRGMIAFASTYRYNKLVFGAWGCGAFKNDARLISSLFHKAFKEFKVDKFNSSMIFDRVTFAVLDESVDQYNYNCFADTFSDYYADEDNAVTNSILKRVNEREKAYLDKFQGCLIGGAAGDALGYPVEFLPLNSILKKYGKNGITSYKLDSQSQKALISDDTQMTLFTANGLLFMDTRGSMRGIAGEPQVYIRMAYQNWLKTQGIPNNETECSWLLNVRELYARRAPGNTCISALTSSLSNEQNSPIKNIINQSKGCGGVMRVAPIGLFFNYNNIESIDEDGAEAAEITHTHPLGYMPAALLTHIINRIVYGNNNNLEDIVNEGIETVVGIYKDKPNCAPYIEELVNIMTKAIRLSSNEQSDFDNIKELGEGWVAEEALAIAVYCSLRYSNDFSRGIIAAVNHDGDSDSTGAITGNILGTLLGYNAISDKWKNDLELKDVILEMAKDLCDGCQMSEYGTYRDPIWKSKYIWIKYPNG